MKDAHVGALIEDLRGQFKVFGEALQTTNEKLDRLDSRITSLDGRMTSLDGRMTTLEDKVDGIAFDVSDVKKRLTHVEHALNGTRSKRKK